MVKYNESSVLTLTDLVPVRHRPGQFGVDVFEKQGVYLIVKEILDNSVDEAVMDKLNKHVIKVCFIKKGRGFQVIVQDSGRGVPLRAIIPIFTKLFTSGKWEDNYETSAGTHGVGAKATVAMSKIFCAVSSRKGEGRAILCVENGEITHHKLTEKNKDVNSGTVVFFEPDPSLMSCVVDFFEPGNAYDDLRSLMDFISVFVPNIVFEVSTCSTPIKVEDVKDTPDKVYNLLTTLPVEIITSSSHLLEPPEYLLKNIGVNSRIIWDSNDIKHDSILVPVTTSTGVIKSKAVSTTHKKMSYNVRFFITNDFSLRASGVLGAVNMVNINDKTSVHITGLIDSLKNILLPFVEEKYNDYFQKIYVLPIHLISIVTWQHATFTGQHKHKFSNCDFNVGFIKALTEQFKSMPEEFWKKLYATIADDIVIKFDRHNKLALDISKSNKNLAFELNNLGCYYECRSADKNITELIICEGASAGDYVKDIRDDEIQAVFKLTGKPINALQMTFTDSMKNKIYNDLVKVLGTSPSDTNLDDLRFGRLVILTDGDQDGYHITSLLIGILYTINPKLLFDGRVIVASPPLYIVKMGTNSLFVRDNRALLDVKAEGYKAALEVYLEVDGNYNNAFKLDGEYFRSFCHMIYHIGTIITNVANKLNIYAGILEQLIHCLDDIESMNTNSIIKKLGLKSCVYEKISNSLIMDLGDIDVAIPLSGLISDVKQYILPELKLINWDRINFRVTTLLTTHHKDQYLSIIEIYNLFETLNEKFCIKRMKGLGEMDRKHLSLTCLDPVTRTYMTIRSPGDVDNIFRLLGVDTKLRKDLVFKNVQK